MVPIDKGLAIPDAGHTKRGAPPKYPWKEMDVGDSFAWPRHLKRSGTYSVSLQKSKLLAPKKFVTRAYNGELRCWRVA
jgi:hypothetical protein